jgi:4'-phosphopantetheinyl transferase EntD
MARCDLNLPVGFVLGESAIDEKAGIDRHAAGRAAAHEALRRIGCRGELVYEGTRPLVAGPDGDHVRISITHGKRRALAVAARVPRLGIDLADEDRRLPALAERFFATEHQFAKSPRELAACFAAKEAGLKALGLGLLDGDMFDDCVVKVTSLAPPRITCGLAKLELVLRIVPEGVLAIAFMA